tara:strand:+ start:932 stop:1063 length:132 start_codon:yes stop_codon:yes gene_type:complete
VTTKHKETLKLYFKFVIRDVLNINELKEFKNFIDETINELRNN